MLRAPDWTDWIGGEGDVKVWMFFVARVQQMGVSIVMGVPQNSWVRKENPMKADDDWGYPYFRKPP